MELVVLSGFARSGKDEAAKVLVEEHGFRRIAFADKLREMLYALNPMIDIEHLVVDEDYFWRKPAMRVHVQEVINGFGWDGYKETVYEKEIRRLLQRLGTEAGREALWPNIWVDALFSQVKEGERVVIPDGRFFNEFDAVLQRGGSVWRIERTGVGPANDHASELEAIDYPDFEYTILNDGSLEDFRKKILGLSYWEVPRGSVI